MLALDEVVAGIRAPSGMYGRALSSTAEELIRAGKLIPPRGESRECPKSPVRSLDALHLATVLAFCELYGSVAVLSYDSCIRDNLAALGVPSAQ